MIYKFTVEPIPGADTAQTTHLRNLLGLADITTARDYYIETEETLQANEIDRIRESLANPLTEKSTVGRPFDPERMVQIMYKSSIVDNENESLVAMCRLLGIKAIAGKIGTTYQSSDSNLYNTVKKNLFNPSIEELHRAEPDYDSLLPVGYRVPMETFDLCPLADKELEVIGKQDGRNLTLAQMRQVKKLQQQIGLPFISDVLIEALDARWSDHCAHTTWKSLGNLLNVLMSASKNTRNPNIVSMFYDNAGVWNFYEGYCLAFKAETHNGPTAISAYFGQLTKLGGVLRDILGTGLGADPIGTFEYTATGLPHAAPPFEGCHTPRQIGRETIRAIKEYGNTFGVPMMWSKMTFHPKYIAKPFALGGCIGLVPKKFAQKGRPLPGDYVLLIGGLTGNDGIHGASASSAGSSMDQASVQIGSPLEEVKFRQAIIDLRDSECIRAITDLGAAGLNSAVGEMGEACGVWLNTALVPLKTSGLATWRILLSESQERMALAIAPDRLEKAEAILDLHEVRHTVIGRFTDSGRYTVIHDEQISVEDIKRSDFKRMPLSGEVGIDVPYESINEFPLPRLSITPETTTPKKHDWPILSFEELQKVATSLLQDTEVADQTFAGSQYDTTVQGITYYGPYFGKEFQVATSYWAGTPIYGKNYAAVFSASFNPWLYECNPVLAAKQCFLSLLQSQVLAGVRLENICLCDNFYTPHLDKHGYYWLAEMVKELARLSVTFKTPFISGKDSSAGSVRTPDGQVISVPPAVFLSALGKVENCSTLVPNELRNAGNLLVRIGPRCESIAGTLASRIFGITANDLDDVPTNSYLDYLRDLSTLASEAILSGATIGTGGTLTRIMLTALGSELGVELESPPGRYFELLQEHRCGAIIEISPTTLHALPESLNAHVIGRVTDAKLSVKIEGCELLGDEQIYAWKNAYRDLLK